MVLARVWEDGDRKLERKLKNWNNGGRLCPICCGEAVQMPLVPGMPAYVPEPEQDEVDDGHDSPPLPDGPDLFDYAGEHEDLVEDMLDREYHARGAW
jgi:hypothetical protein